MLLSLPHFNPFISVQRLYQCFGLWLLRHKCPSHVTRVRGVTGRTIAVRDSPVGDWQPDAFMVSTFLGSCLLGITTGKWSKWINISGTFNFDAYNVYLHLCLDPILILAHLPLYYFSAGPTRGWGDCRPTQVFDLDIGTCLSSVKDEVAPIPVPIFKEHYIFIVIWSKYVKMVTFIYLSRKSTNNHNLFLHVLVWKWGTGICAALKTPFSAPPSVQSVPQNLHFTIFLEIFSS